ncbi:MAG: hypothetical protein GY719_23060 [bacterium]|nr:hypothetical protein [bacterium]
MNTFPGSPKVRKGALVVIDPLDPIPKVISFQYNPETLSRSLEAQTAGEAELDATAMAAPPIESIKLEADLDATDQLEAGEQGAEELGLHPQLAVLELLLYPSTARVIANTVLLALGTMEVTPPTGPMVLFIWGPQRILPVRLTEFSVTEEAYDPRLNPIRAKVSLGLRVLSYHDLPLTHPGYALFLAHQVTKEAMAMVARANDLGAVLDGDAQLF